jgi:F0F1-type ATP synthase gamma subunit
MDALSDATAQQFFLFKYTDVIQARIEPHVTAKRSLTGGSAERVVIRVWQVIFELDCAETLVYVGQPMDVFIQRRGGNVTAKNP